MSRRNKPQPDNLSPLSPSPQGPISALDSSPLPSSSPYPCHFCHRPFSTPNALQRHTNETHPVCSICYNSGSGKGEGLSMRFGNALVLGVHMRVSHGVRGESSPSEGMVVRREQKPEGKAEGKEEGMKKEKEKEKREKAAEKMKDTGKGKEKERKTAGEKARGKAREKARERENVGVNENENENKNEVERDPGAWVVNTSLPPTNAEGVEGKDPDIDPWAWDGQTSLPATNTEGENPEIDPWAWDNQTKLPTPAAMPTPRRAAPSPSPSPSPPSLPPVSLPPEFTAILSPPSTSSTPNNTSTFSCPHPLCNVTGKTFKTLKSLEQHSVAKHSSPASAAKHSSPATATKHSSPGPAAKHSSPGPTAITIPLSRPPRLPALLPGRAPIAPMHDSLYGNISRAWDDSAPTAVVAAAADADDDDDEDDFDGQHYYYDGSGKKLPTGTYYKQNVGAFSVWNREEFMSRKEEMMEMEGSSSPDPDVVEGYAAYAPASSQGIRNKLPTGTYYHPDGRAFSVWNLEGVMSKEEEEEQEEEDMEILPDLGSDGNALNGVKRPSRRSNQERLPKTFTRRTVRAGRNNKKGVVKPMPTSATGTQGSSTASCGVSASVETDEELENFVSAMDPVNPPLTAPAPGKVMRGKKDFVTKLSDSDLGDNIVRASARRSATAGKVSSSDSDRDMVAFAKSLPRRSTNAGGMRASGKAKVPSSDLIELDDHKSVTKNRREQRSGARTHDDGDVVTDNYLTQTFDSTQKDVIRVRGSASSRSRGDPVASGSRGVVGGVTARVSSGTSKRRRRKIIIIDMSGSESEEVVPVRVTRGTWH